MSESPGGSGEEARRRLATARAELARIRAAGSSPTATAARLDGQVVCVVARGRVDSLRLDPRVMRLPAPALAESVLAAVNEALAASGPQVAPPAEPTLDAAALSAQLRAVVNEASRTAGAIAASITETIGRLGARTGMHGDPDAIPLRALLGDVQASVTAAGATAVASPASSGAGADGQIRAWADSGRLAELEIDTPAMRLPSADLAEELEAAVNAALGSASGARDLAELHDLAVGRVTDYMRGLGRTMASIGEPEGAAVDGGDG